MICRSDPGRTNVPLRVASQPTHTGRVTRFASTVMLALAIWAGTADARGGHGSNDIRVAATCGVGATTSLRVRARDDGIEIRFRLRQTRGRGSWRVTIVHENRVAVRATAKTTRADDSFEVRRVVEDLQGSDTVVVHAWGPKGLGCRLTATLRGS
jgi:hypothetical protein